MPKKFERLEPVIEGFLYRECLTILAAGPYTGKSRLAMHLSLALTTGKETIFGKIDPINILYCSERGWKENCETFIKSDLKPEELPERLRFFCLPDSLGKSQGEDNLIYGNTYQYIETTQLTDFKADLVIFDTTMRFNHPAARRNGDYANSYTVNLKVLDGVKAWAIKNQVAVLLVYHSPKQNDKTKYNDPFHRILGSQAILGSSTAVCVMEKIEGTEHGVILYLDSHIDKLESPRVFEMDNFAFKEVLLEERTKEVALSDLQQKVLKLIPDDRYIELTTLVTDLHEAMPEVKTRNQISNVIRALKKKEYVEFRQFEPGITSVRRIKPLIQ